MIYCFGLNGSCLLLIKTKPRFILCVHMCIYALYVCGYVCACVYNSESAPKTDSTDSCRCLLWLPTSRLLVYELPVLLVDGGGVGWGGLFSRWVCTGWNCLVDIVYSQLEWLARVNEEGFEECLGYLHRLLCSPPPFLCANKSRMMMMMNLTNKWDSVSNDVNIVIGILKGCLEIFQASKFLNYLIYV